MKRIAGKFWFIYESAYFQGETSFFIIFNRKNLLKRNCSRFYIFLADARHKDDVSSTRHNPSWANWLLDSKIWSFLAIWWNYQILNRDANKQVR